MPVVLVVEVPDTTSNKSYVYGVVPPIGVTITDPSATPLQEIEVGNKVALKSSGCKIANESITEQTVLASTISTQYVPAAGNKLVTLLVVFPFHHVTLRDPEPPDGLTAAEPSLAPKQEILLVVRLDTICVPCVIVAETVFAHPLASITVQV
jgi:hypothetical protein